jgi:CheY-like chemotaxis protein
MILIVDDNKNYIDRLVTLLDEAGNTGSIITANDYNEAISLIAKEKPNIVLLDMNMPGKSGIEVLHYIKREGWDCKVIMITNHSNESYQKLCRDAGADHFLDKSRDFELIPSLIDEIRA